MRTKTTVHKICIIRRELRRSSNQAESHWQDLCGCKPVPRRDVQRCGNIWGRPTDLSVKQSVSVEDESCERALTKQKPMTKLLWLYKPLLRRGACAVVRHSLRTSHRPVLRAVSGYICDRTCERAQRVHLVQLIRSGWHLVCWLMVDSSFQSFWREHRVGPAWAYNWN